MRGVELDHVEQNTTLVELVLEVDHQAQRIERLDGAIDRAITEVSAFLSSLAVGRRVSASTQNQALAALMFLYSEVLERDLGVLGDIVHAKRPSTLPVVMSRSEVSAVLSKLAGVDASWRRCSMDRACVCSNALGSE